MAMAFQGAMYHSTAWHPIGVHDKVENKQGLQVTCAQVDKLGKKTNIDYS